MADDEDERGAKCWKNVDADDGRRSLHVGAASTTDRMLFAIQPCSGVVASCLLTWGKPDNARLG